jgi:2-oxoglutarate dehydrogenase E1 component
LEKFFQDFEWKRSTGTAAQSVASPSAGTADYDQISEKLHKEFNVLKLIEGYRTVGICLQNKSCKRQKDF